MTAEETVLEDRCFWSNTGPPPTKRDKVAKPDTIVRCPVTKEPLRYKDLFAVAFTKLDSADRQASYKCAVTGDILTNATALVALRTSGSVITEAAYDHLVRQSMSDPINCRPVTPKDVVFLKRGASSFAQIGGTQLVSQVSAPVMQC